MTRKESLDVLDAVYKQMTSMSEDEFFNYMTEHSPTFRETVKKIEAKEPDSTAAQEYSSQEISINVCDLDIFVAYADLSFTNLYTSDKSSDKNNIGDKECQLAA